jgi:hypothetical protein
MNFKKILKWYILVTSLYLIADGVVHILDIKLIDTRFWPEQSVIYSRFIGHLYGFFVVLAGLFGIEAQRDLVKYKNFVYLTAIWLFFYGIHLLFFGATVDFNNVFLSEPSVYMWIPFYSKYLIFESMLCFLFTILTFFWWRSERKA